ncbi:MAG: xylose isomerase [Chitinophagaceae bacterium]|nr:MAG: xylose isomerase [Chitinophagaceae bacterium]
MMVAVVAAVMLIMSTSLNAQKSGKKLYAKDNLIAWCIVPFDNQKRTPEQRAQMLNGLGINKLAYDWREKDVPTFDDELNALKKHNITLQSFWYYSGPHPENDKNFATIIDLLKRHNVKTQIWTMITGIEGLDSMTQEQKVEAVSKPVRYIAEKAAEAGSSVGLYNHGGWFGEPENELAIIEKLKLSNLGMVYNFSHSEEQIHRFPDFYPKILPHLLAINLTGLQGGIPAKVVPVGQGNIEYKMMKIIEESSYAGPIGIINEDFAPDAEDGLKMNMEGLKKYLKEYKNSAALATY